MWKLLRGRGDGNENLCHKYAHLYPFTCTWYFWKPSKSLQTQRTENLTKNVLLFSRNDITIDPIFLYKGS